MDGDTILPYASADRPRDWRGWALVVGCGVAAGLLGGGVRIRSLAGPMVAGVVIGIISALAASFRPLLLAVVGSAAAVVAFVATIVVPRWYSGQMPLGRMVTDLRLLFGIAGLLLLVCVPAVLGAVITSYIKRRVA